MGLIRLGTLPVTLLVMTLVTTAGAEAVPDAPRDLTDLSIEELSNVIVTSVARRPQALADAPASIHVITGEQIRTAGARTLPEALRLAPNLQVARIDARQYAISARGFQASIANKLLVLIDGRIVYSPLFSGVFWDAQDLVPEDIERIEVISGPGAATWGTNAVNGVINVTTRRAEDTQGLFVSVGAGNFERSAAIRYGGALGARGFFRVYAQGFQVEDTELADGSSVLDDWERAQAGFRSDWLAGRESFTVQGDAHSASTGPRVQGGPVELSGANLLGRWARRDENGAGVELQAYYEHVDRDDDLLLQEQGTIFDVDFKQTLPAGAHALTWGAGARHAEDVARASPLFAFIPERQNLGWYHVFAQDQIALRDDLELTLGARLERNDYTGWEVLPSARLGWRLRDAQLLWGALSRAVRSPARLDREIFIPAAPPFIVGGGPNFDSEIAEVVELGYRAQPKSAVSFSATAFHHIYDRLRSAEIAPPGSNTFLLIANGVEGEISGLEAWGNLQANARWRLSLGGFLIDKDLRLKPGRTDPVGPSNLGNDPDYQAILRSTFDLTPRHELDVFVRHIARLPQPNVPDYTAVDLRVGWTLNTRVALSLRLQNLFDAEHGEFGDVAGRSEFERTGFLRLTWNAR